MFEPTNHFFSFGIIFYSATFLYQCSTCPDFDLCSSCIEVYEAGSPGVRHPDGHIFYRIPRPLPQHAPPSLNNRSQFYHPAPCTLCSEFIVGYKYSCLECPDADSNSWCERCEQIGVHFPLHARYDINGVLSRSAKRVSNSIFLLFLSVDERTWIPITRRVW